MCGSTTASPLLPGKWHKHVPLDRRTRMGGGWGGEARSQDDAEKYRLQQASCLLKILAMKKGEYLDGQLTYSATTTK